MAEYNTEIDLCPLQRKYDKIMEKEHHHQIPAATSHQTLYSWLSPYLHYQLSKRGEGTCQDLFISNSALNSVVNINKQLESELESTRQASLFINKKLYPKKANLMQKSFKLKLKVDERQVHNSKRLGKLFWSNLSHCITTITNI